MKKYLIILSALIFMFSACSTDPSIVGKWIVTSDDRGSDYVNHNVTYTFQADHNGLVEAQFPNDSTYMMELEWNLTNDTLIISNADTELPTMPQIAIVKKITKQEMTWGIINWGSGNIIQTELKRI